MNSVQNSVQLIGNLGQDPLLNTGKGDDSFKVVRFSIATNEVYTDRNNQRKEETQWHSCVAFGRRAETMHKYLKKGSKVAVSGKLRYNSYQDKNGQTQNKAEIVVSDFKFLDVRAAG